MSLEVDFPTLTEDIKYEKLNIVPGVLFSSPSSAHFWNWFMFYVPLFARYQNAFGWGNLCSKTWLFLVCLPLTQLKKKSFSSGTVGGMCHACHSNNKRWLLLHHGEKNCIFCTICPFCLRLMIISSCNLWVGIFSYCASASFYICFITNLHSSILFFLH